MEPEAVPPAAPGAEPESRPAEQAPAEAQPGSDAPASAARRAWEGAIGLTVSHRPEFSGASQQVSKITPAIFLRYGRFTITNASGFVTRRADDVVRGLGIDLAKSERLRINLALRFDAGRSESTSTALAGLGNIKPTVRTRLNVGWRFDGPWRLGASWSVDALGRGGGNFGDVSAGWEHRLSPATVFSAGLSLAAAGDRYMQTYYGINQAQAARTGHPVYTPSAGLRDMAATVGMRTDLNSDWVLLAGGGASRLIGPAAQSPLTTHRNGWGINVGLAWRF
ncbi:MAG: MipA/OmpV family protein [Rubrivivax sp.]|nr:MipA/OmpV family protein [Rubrivivax sp.]